MAKIILLGLDVHADSITVVRQIDGAMPRLNAIPPGCAFNPRCPKAFDRCFAERPDLLDAGATQAACWLHAADATASQEQTTDV